MRIHCPFCGERDHSEFSYGGDATIQYPDLDGSMEDWHNAVFMRDNPKGKQLETWHHVQGCRLWLIVERDNVSHEIHSVQAAHPALNKFISPDQEADHGN